MLKLSDFRAYQNDAVDFIMMTSRCALWIFMGGGKTAATLTALDRLSLTEEIYPVLVIAPLRVAHSVWPTEPSKWEHLCHLKVVPILGTALERRNALHRKADIYTINFDNLSWLAEQVGDNWPFKTVVADEFSRLKGFRLRQGTKRARSLARYAHKNVKRFIGLTGTPASNGLKDLWGQLWFLDGGERLGRTYDAFSQRWFQRSFDGFGLNPLPHAQKEIQDRVKDICMSLNAKDHFDLKEPIKNTIYVDLPPAVRKQYKDMEKQMFMEIDEHEIEAFNAAARTQKLLQICNGAAYVGENAESWVEVHDAKIKALDSIIEEAAGMPVLVAYHFRSDLERLRKAFPQGRVLDNNPETIQNWNEGKLPILFAHPQSAGHGLNLQEGSNIIAFFSINWNLEEHLQIIERIGPVRQMQSGYDRPVFIHYILARGTIEDSVMERLDGKREVQDILMEAVKKFRQGETI